MGFLALLRSIEELLYELMTWLLFYPRTLWQVVRRPVRMAAYSDAEQRDSADQQYTDTLSPPLFLVLSILLAHGVEVGLQTRIDLPREGVAKTLLSSEENLLFLRCILFSIFPLVFASSFIKRSGQPLDRATLRGPFFSQCYLAGVFALLISLAAIMARYKQSLLLWTGASVTVAAVLWYVTVQALWFRQDLALSPGRATGAAITSFFKASVLNAAVAAIFFA